MPAVSSIGASGAAGSQVSTSSARIADDFDKFLLLLTTQLQNQNPLDPLDTNEFTNQLVQFSAVEQSILTNKMLENLVGLYNANQASQSVSFLGKLVSYEGADFDYSGQPIEIGYGLAGTAAETRIDIVDSNGDVIKSFNGENSAGLHKISWDGTDQNGDAVPEGSYHVNIKAVNDDNETIQTATSVQGIVKSVEFDGEKAILNLGNIQILIDDVLSVSAS